MRPASTAFANVITRSHQAVFAADVLFDREEVDGAQNLRIVSGAVVADRTAARLSRVQSLRIAEPSLIPNTAGGAASPLNVLTPFGYEIRLSRGVMLSTGPELIPLGVFPIQRSQLDGISLLSTVTAEDRSRLVSDARFEDDYPIAAGTNVATAIIDMIDAAVPGLEYSFPTITFTTPAVTLAAQADRWLEAQSMARSVGHELVFDGAGVLVMRPEPTFSGEPSGEITEDENMISASLGLDRGPAYNRVIAISRNASTGETYRGVATDDDPSSPTYYEGPFGKKPRFYPSPFIGSTAQADSAAAGILASQLGVARSLNLSAVPDPRRECGDVINVKRERIGINELHILDKLTIGMSPEAPMTAAARVRPAA